MYKHNDFNKEFLLQPVVQVNQELEAQFIKEISIIDDGLIKYYKSLNLENPEFYELSCETLAIGYVKTFTENKYRLLTEIFIVENFRELGLGTFTVSYTHLTLPTILRV